MYDFVIIILLDEICFIFEIKCLNKVVVECFFKGNYGYELGKILKSSKSEE